MKNEEILWEQLNPCHPSWQPPIHSPVTWLQFVFLQFVEHDSLQSLPYKPAEHSVKKKYWLYRNSYDILQEKEFTTLTIYSWQKCAVRHHPPYYFILLILKKFHFNIRERQKGNWQSIASKQFKDNQRLSNADLICWALDGLLMVWAKAPCRRPYFNL